MATPETLKKEILSASLDERLKKAYVTEENVKEQYDRYINLLNEFEALFGKDRDVRLFSAPGRTEVGGNHTDHNHGRVLAAGINLDAIAAASKNDENIVRVKSEGYSMDVVDAADLSVNHNEMGHSPALVRGVLAGFKKYGYKIGGFDATTASRVIAGSGLSSSAAYEVLVGTMVNYLYNDGKVDAVTIAKIAQYAENEYFGKPCGLMDQMACAVGGPVLFDFADRNDLKYSKLDFSYGKFGHKLVIVNTGKGHADLSQEYSEIPGEMKAVAKVLGVELLHETNVDALLEHCNEIEDDRAVLRALHFFGETTRVEDAADAIHHEDYKKFLELVNESGTSSWELLQNCYTMKDFHEQKITRTLALTQLFLKKIGAGVCRVHGGGFAGVIAAIVPEKEQDNYVEYISRFVGRENVYPMDIRAVGAAHIG